MVLQRAFLVLQGCRTMQKLILASQSPRRMEILRKFDIPFTAVPASLEERFNNDPPEDQVLRLSKEKVDALLKEKPELSLNLVLGADTCISFNHKIIGKPSNSAHAEKILRDFSGKTHQVITGLTLYNGQTQEYIQKSEQAEVTFAPVSDEEIRWYLATDEWKGVAGGYRIQEKGALLIQCISGSYYNIMGLPIRLFYGMLTTQNPQYKLKNL